jgi:hypothetical protein
MPPENRNCSPDAEGSEVAGVFPARGCGILFLSVFLLEKVPTGVRRG